MAKESFFTAVARTLTASAAPAPRRLNGIQASAQVVEPGSKDSSLKLNATTRAWQQQVWKYYDCVGEVHQMAGFIGSCLSRCRLTVGVADPGGNVGPVFDEEGAPLEGMDGAKDALALVQALKSEIGGQAEFLRAMGINLATAGELHLVGSDPNSIDGQVGPGNDLQWEVLSTDEFRPKDKDYERVVAPGVTPTHVPNASVHVIRVWRAHPQFSSLPDSSLVAVLDILEELVLLTREVRGETLSRIANGVMVLIPEEIEWPEDENDDADSGDSFTRDLIQTLTTPISDKASAAAVVPFVFRAPAELLDKVRTLFLGRPNPSDSSEKRKEAVQRLAQGVDLPVEIVTGMAGTTFSNAVQIDDALFKAHIEPILEIICGALTAGYLRPALGRDTPFIVHFDSSELVARPNRAQDAKDLHDRWALSDASLRTSAGFSDSDAPDDEEMQKRITTKQLLNVRQTIPQTSQGLVEEDANIGGNLGDQGAPLDQGNLTDGNNTDGVLAASIRGAAEVSVNRAVRRAGARLRSKSLRNQGIQEQLSQVPDAEVAVTLGPSLVASINKGEDLFKAEFDDLWRWVVQETGDQSYADNLRDACVVVATERMYHPRRDFSLEALPAFDSQSFVMANV